MRSTYQTQGGRLGHWLRRAMHVAMLFVPWVYYHLGSPVQWLWGLISLVVLLEILRFRRGFLLFSQRSNETRRISGFAWGVVSIGLVLWLAPARFAYPIIAACALGDPIMGELRRMQVASLWVILVGVTVISGLWLVSWACLGTPWEWAILMGPLSVAAEWPNLRWVDDNAMMQLVPLLVVTIFL